MIVDEEFKGEKPEWMEKSDSEDEREKKDLDELEHTEGAFTLNEDGTKALADLTAAGTAATLILCAGITSQTLVRINFGEAWKNIGVGESKDKKKDKTDTKCECFLLADSKNAFFFLLPDKDGMKALVSNQITNAFLN